MQLPDERDDRHIYTLVSIHADTFRFLRISLRYYTSLLARDVKAIDTDSDLKELLAIEPGETSLLESELKRIERVTTWWSDIEIQQGKDEFSYEIPGLSHRTIRLLKSVGLLYLKHLHLKRDQIAKQPNASKYTLENLDTVLSKYQEKMETSGVFGKASRIPLLVDELIAQSHATAKPAVMVDQESPRLPDTTRPRPVLLESIQLLDPALRKRCLDLFADFQETKQHDRFDTVIAEATRILEDRLRVALDVKTGTGDDLANLAFGGNAPKLRASDVDTEQRAVLLFFKGVFGHIRNPSHHKLLGNLSPERTIQILGMIDYAIHLIETSEKIS
jgi:hypothetical protein